MDLEFIRIFVKVVQFGSFSRAAEFLRTPKSTVSKTVSRLERETGTKLLLRTTRSLTLTAAGRVFYEASLGPITQLEDAQKSLYGQDSIVSGSVRITAPEDLGSIVVAPAIAELSVRFPNLRFDLEYTDEVIDLVKEGFDIAVRLGRLNESSFKVKKVGEVVLILVAAPTYLKVNDKIKQPQDLKNHMCLSLSSLSHTWILKSEKGKARVEIQAKISSNQMSSLLMMAKSGAGVALLPRFLSQSFVASGDLVQILPDWSAPGIAASLVTPLASTSSARLKLTVDHLATSLSKVLG